MEVGEPITTPEIFVSEELHNKKICPWHEQGGASSQQMDATDPDEDTEQMPPNDGGKLGRNMTDEGDTPPSVNEVAISYQPSSTIKYKSGKKTKTAQTYVESDDDEPYGLQYAPHHLIPGNESLKGSDIVSFLGDENAITNFAAGKPSHIKNGKSVGYDVNNAGNGVWLPSPYALSMKNNWPAEPAIRVLKRRKKTGLARTTEEFKAAYVAATIEVNDTQFHMRHKDYSTKVKEILDTIAERLALMACGMCPIAAESGAGDDKFEPPGGLKARLVVLSSNLRRLLTGSVWRDPLYTDDMTREYADDLKHSDKQGRIAKVV